MRNVGVKLEALARAGERRGERTAGGGCTTEGLIPLSSRVTEKITHQYILLVINIRFQAICNYYYV